MKTGTLRYTAPPQPEPEPAPEPTPGPIPMPPPPYDRRWRLLSEQIRATHPYCSMCHATEGEEYMDGSGKIRGVRLTVDHIDGHPSNNDRANLRVLCAACHGSLTSDNWRR
jgi:hypothetical protein